MCHQWVLLSSVHLLNIFWWSVQKRNLDLFWRRSNKTRQIQYGVAYSRIFFMLDDNWSFRWFIGKFSYVRSFERHDCNCVLCFGIDVSVKTRITKKIGWKKSPCSWHFFFMLSYLNLAKQIGLKAPTIWFSGIILTILSFSPAWES